ncbi:hypothetical protein TNCT_559451 [Trichonephila clavata]|uniref:Uncharacterized protein n=1 Tax=Trichonephila clavata TaxID=2740835 RepID=A0A8X6F0Z6_TRICU|nr:hypothetical protein TNCT_559451 [Trichonephila clavata]
MVLSCALGNIASDLAKSSGNLKAECAVRPPASRFAAMPEEATATAMSFSFLTKANIKLKQAHGGGQSLRTGPFFWLEEARVRLGWNETCLRTFPM